MSNLLLRSRITARHPAATSLILDELIRASREPNAAFAILEGLADTHPDLGARLVDAANSAGRRGIVRIRTSRQAIVRLGLVAASEVLLETTHKKDPTVATAA